MNAVIEAYARDLHVSAHLILANLRPLLAAAAELAQGAVEFVGYAADGAAVFIDQSTGEDFEVQPNSQKEVMPCPAVELH